MASSRRLDFVPLLNDRLLDEGKRRLAHLIRRRFFEGIRELGDWTTCRTTTDPAV